MSILFQSCLQPLLSKFPRTECLLTDTLEAPCPESMQHFLNLNQLGDFPEIHILCEILHNKETTFYDLRAKSSDIYENPISAKLETRNNSSILRIVNNTISKVWFSKDNTIISKFHKRGFVFSIDSISMGAKVILKSKFPNSVKQRLLRLNASGYMHCASLIKLRLIESTCSNCKEPLDDMLHVFYYCLSLIHI